MGKKYKTNYVPPKVNIEPRKLIKYEMKVKKPKRLSYWFEVEKSLSMLVNRQAQSRLLIVLYDNESRMFPEMCICAPIYAKLREIKDWEPMELNEIKTNGIALHHRTRLIFKLKMGEDYKLKPSCIYPIFILGSHHVNMLIGNECMKDADIMSNEDKVKLQNLIDTNDGVIFVVKNKHFSIWKNAATYLLYSPSHREHIDRSYILKSNSCDLIIEYVKKSYQLQDHFSAYCVKILGTEKIHEDPESIMDKYYELLAAELPIRDICQPTPYVKDDKAQLLLERKEVDRSDRADFEFFEGKFSADFYNELFEDRGFLSGSSYCKVPDAVLHTNISAAIFFTEVRTIKWTKETVNDVLRLGKRLYADSEMDGCTSSPDWTKRVLTPIQFNNKELEIEYENLIFGEVVTQEKNVYTIKQGVLAFFKQHDLGIIWGPQVQLIWQQSGLFFTFSPKERDAVGRKWLYALSKELPENKIKPKGNACLSWFKNPATLADAYVCNVSLKHRRDQFRIVKIKFIEAKKVLEDWNNWTCYLDNKWRLMGDKTICDFLEPDRYELSYPKIFCIAAMVALYHTSRTTSKWEKKTLDELLNFGNIYYEESVIQKPDLEDNFDMKNLKKFYILLNKTFVLFFTSCAVSGFVFQPMRTSPVLEKGFQQFFCNFQFGVLVIRDIAIPIFMESGFYYMIFVYDKIFGTKDTCLCSLDNLYSTVRGHAYILRFKNLSDFYEELIRCMAVEENDRYCIHAIEKRLRVGLLNYTKLGLTGAQLRPLDCIHEGSEIFGLRANRQTMANLLISICYAFITRPIEWEQYYINEILQLGDRILCRLLANNKNCKEKYYELTLDDVIPFVGTNKFTFVQKSNFGVFKYFPPLPANGEEEEGIMEEEEGDTAPAVVEEMDLDGEEGGAVTIVPTYDKDLEMLLQGWKNMETGWAILLSRLFNLALWKKEEVYFLFDPQINDIEGMLTQRRMAMVIDKILDEIKPNYTKLPNKGSAYVAYFYTLETFVDHILLRVPEEFIKDKINLITLEITSPAIVNKDLDYKKSETFRNVNLNQGIIRSNISQDEPLFYYRNRQEGAISLVALAFASISNPGKWSSEMLDLILRYGDRLYLKSLEIERDDHPITFDITKKLPLKTIQLKFYIYKIKFELKLIQRLSNCVSSYSENNEIRRFLTKLPSMKPNNMGCLITCKGYTNALFKLGTNIFSFDPYKTDPEGYFSNDGLANYSRFASPESYLEFFVPKFLCEQKSNKFEVIQFEVVKTYPLGLVAFDFEQYEFSKKLPKNQLIFKDIGDDMKLMSYYYEYYEIPDSFLCVGAILCGNLKYVEFWDYNEMKKVAIIGDYIRNQLHCKETERNDGPAILEEINYTIRIDNKLCNLNVSHVSEASIGKELDSSNLRLRHCLDKFFARKKYCIVGNADGYCYALWYDATRYYMFWLNHDIMQTMIQSAADWKSLYNVIEREGKSTNKVYYVMHVQTFVIELNEEFLLDIKPIVKKLPIDKKRGCERFEFPELCEKCYYNSFDYNLKKMWKHEKKSKESFKRFAQGIDIFQPCYHLEDHRFHDSESYFSYLQACCLLAAAMFSIKGFEHWDKKTIDNILKSGNDLYVASVGVNRKTLLDITEFEQVFTLCTITTKVMALTPTKEFFELENLLTILTYILRKHKMAYLMESDNICITLITDEINYYIFYPGSMTPPNLSVESTCLIRFDNLERMARFIIESYKVGTNYITIGPIVTIEKCQKPIVCEFSV